MLRAKASARAFAGGNGGDVFRHDFPCWGCHCGASKLVARVSRGENLVHFGHATATTYWRYDFLEGIVFLRLGLAFEVLPFGGGDDQGFFLELDGETAGRW